VRRKEVKRFLKNFLRNKRGITPVLSELLLTVIAVAAMSIATTTTYVITTNLRENMSERVLVEDVWFHNSPHSVEVYMSNIGKVDFTISNVYVNHTSQTFDTSFRLGIEEHGWFSIMYNWNSGDRYYVDIVTNRGTHIADYYRAP
jgi:Flp pilus assembly pilin Flp